MAISKSNPAKSTPHKKTTQTRLISEEERRRMIAEAAYLRAQQRGFEGGDPVADWLVAETEINKSLAKRSQHPSA